MDTKLNLNFSITLGIGDWGLGITSGRLQGYKSKSF